MRQIKSYRSTILFLRYLSILARYLSCVVFRCFVAAMPFRLHSVRSGYGPSGIARTLYHVVTVVYAGFIELLTLNNLSLAHNILLCYATSPYKQGVAMVTTNLYIYTHVIYISK